MTHDKLPSQKTMTYEYTTAQLERALRRADKRHGLLAIPQPPRITGPMAITLLTVALCLAGMVALRHANLSRFVHATCNPTVEEGCR